MTELKPVERTLRIVQKIREENTGSRIEFVEYVGLAPQNLTHYINKISKVLKVEIGYSRKRQTYYFKCNCHKNISF